MVHAPDIPMPELPEADHAFQNASLLCGLIQATY